MVRTRIIYRLLATFLLFAFMVVVPVSMTIMREVSQILSQGVGTFPMGSEQLGELGRRFRADVFDQVVPYAFYVVMVAFILSVAFLRKMLISLKRLEVAAGTIKEGNLAARVEPSSRDELGEVIQAFNEMAEILDRRTTELQRKDTYVNAMVDPLWVLDGEGLVADINPAFTRLFGYARDDVIGASVHDFFDEENGKIIRRQLEEVRRERIPATCEVSILLRDGHPMPVLASSSPIFSDGRVLGNIGILKDFREQSALREELRRSKEYLESVMDSITDQIIVIDRDLRIVKANRVAEAFGGGSIVGRQCHEVSHGLPRPCWMEGNECPAQMVTMTGKHCTTTHEHINHRGEKRLYEISASPIRDAAGNVLQVIEVLRDVTERMRQEEEIVRKNREFSILNSISAILSRSLLPDETVARVLHEMVEMMDMDGGGIYFIDDATRMMTCVFHRGISPEYADLMGKVKVGDDIPGRIAVTGQTVTTPDLLRDTRFDGSFLRQTGIRAYCCFPVRGKERTIGVFCLFGFRPRIFSREEEGILTSVGGMTGIALENIRLYEAMRELYEQQRKRREAEHAQLLSLSAQLGAHVGIKAVIGDVLSLLKDFFRADLVWLLACDKAGAMIFEAATVSAWTAGDIVYEADKQSVESLATMRKATVTVQDVRERTDCFVNPVIAGRNPRTAVAVPMFIGEKPVGVYTLYYRDRREMKEEELHFAEIIGNVLAVSIERSDYYAKAITEKGLSDAILQSVTDGIITVSEGCAVVSANPAFERMVGIGMSPAIGKPVCDIFRFSDGNVGFRVLLGECMESALNGTPASRTAVLTTAYGNRVSLMISSAPIRHADGRTRGVVNVLRDISREKEIDRMKTEIIRSVSHEFRTPLSAIVGMTEMMLDGDIDAEKGRHYLTVILNEGIRLAKMVSDLLSIARIESDREGLKVGPVDVESLLDGILGMFAPAIERKGASVSCVSRGAVLLGDEEKLRQLFSNVIENALTFSDRGCRIDIRAGLQEGGLEIVVSDTGWGVPEEDLPHLGETFYRGMHGRTVKGTGLGLSLCREIVKMHGGTMEIRSIFGKGTDVVFRFPCKEGP